MPTLVTSGAMLQCSRGSTPSVLQIPAASGITAGNAPVATATHTTGAIRPFGACAAMYPPQPCTPAPGANWATSSPSVRAGAMPVLNLNSKCSCQRGGLISIVAPGQQTTTVAAAASDGAARRSGAVD
jgi:hypothetical protein